MSPGAFGTDEVREEDEVWLFPLRGEDVCSLEGLWAVAEQVVDVEDGFRCGRITSDVLTPHRRISR